MSKVVITGGAGFVGTNLSLYMLNKGYEVVSLDISDRHTRLHESGVLPHSNLDFQTLDLAMKEPALGKDVAAIFHLAALPHVDYSYFHPHQVITNNLESLLRVMEIAIKLDVPLIFSSSVEVYGGKVEKLYSEGDALNPLSPYAASKAACEAIIGSYVETQGLKASIFRLTNLYGPWQAPDRLLPRIISQILLGIPSTIEKGTNRDFVFIGDACEVLEKAMHFKHTGEVFNLCTGKKIDNFDAVMSVANILPGSKLKTMPPRKRDGRGRFLIAKPGKLYESSGWRTHTDLATGIAETVDWYKAHSRWIERFAPQITSDRTTDKFLTDTESWR